MQENSKKIFICDDEKNIAELIRMYLETNYYDCEIFSDGESLLKKLETEGPDLITLDIMLPGHDGFFVLSEIRRVSEVPVILISAKDTEIDKVHGFNVGSDDYIVKPFMPLELVARIKNILKRTEKNAPSVIEKEEDKKLEFSNIVIDRDLMEVKIADKKVPFTKIEYRFLEYFIKNSKKALSKKEILSYVWGYSEDDARVIDDLLKRFRKKLEESGANIIIETIWGVGYRLVDTSAKNDKNENDKSENDKNEKDKVKISKIEKGKLEKKESSSKTEARKSDKKSVTAKLDKKNVKKKDIKK